MPLLFGRYFQTPPEQGGCCRVCSLGFEMWFRDWVREVRRVTRRWGAEISRDTKYLLCTGKKIMLVLEADRRSAFFSSWQKNKWGFGGLMCERRCWGLWKRLSSADVLPGCLHTSLLNATTLCPEVGWMWCAGAVRVAIPPAPQITILKDFCWAQMLVFLLKQAGFLRGHQCLSVFLSLVYEKASSIAQLFPLSPTPFYPGFLFWATLLAREEPVIYCLLIDKLWQITNLMACFFSLSLLRVSMT